ncbi:MAG: hypothetical protein WCA10_25870 [Terracidiphilus sp.]
MTAVETLLAGLIDYAGLYPPAGLDMRTAVRNYLDYRGGPHAFALGRFIVDIARTDELREFAGDAFRAMPLSVIATPEIDLQRFSSLIGNGFRIESIEIKCAEPATIDELGRRLPKSIERYIEVPIDGFTTPVFDVLAASEMRAKLRMGGVVPEAFPDAKSVAFILKELFSRKIAFKATAGLHHPIRSRHHLTYAPDSSTAVMHGFLNLACTAALLHSGWSVDEAIDTLREEDPSAWDASPDVIRCRNFAWNSTPLRDMHSFFTSFGSCSFTEPIRDLEVLGWL